MREGLKIVISTIPIRPIPTEFPPFGCLAVIQALRDAGFDPYFLDIDGKRPSFEDVMAFLGRESPDVVGISAVVASSYGYVKRLCTSMREVLPSVKIVLGGNLAASAEILHRFCGVDVCVIGEGERVIVNVARYCSVHPVEDDFEELKRIRGITFVDSRGEVVFTGYEDSIPPEELSEPDFAILERYSNIDNFVVDPFLCEDISRDPRSYEPHRAGKKLGTVVFSKGCVGRCTFCHRWDKGFRQIPPERIIERIRHLMDRYNVGFLQFGDEAFGADRKATRTLISLIKPLDILWKVSGVRARSVDRDLLLAMRDAGCVGVHFGFESGSPDMLKVMDKRTELEDNVNAARWAHEAGIHTVYPLVLGMPGETHRTISETADMIKRVTEYLPDPPAQHVVFGYIQALPGTPAYEYARAMGLIGPAPEGEEEYLLSISDRPATDDNRFINFTSYPYLAVRTWKRRILYEATVHWHAAGRGKKGGRAPGPGAKIPEPYRKRGLPGRFSDGGGATLLRAFYPIRGMPIWLWVLMTEFRENPMGRFLSRVRELITSPFRNREGLHEYRSLRQIVKEIAPPPRTQTEANLAPLREGR